MQDFDDVLSEQLDSMPMGDVQGKLDLVLQLSQELEASQQQTLELETRLRHAMEEYNILLASALRRRIPGVGINRNNGRCSAAYKSTNLSCKPDIKARVWSFDPNRHGRRFTRKNGPALNLSNEVDALADAIATYFGRYKSLK
jgi:hypothetical protein